MGTKIILNGHVYFISFLLVASYLFTRCYPSSLNLNTLLIFKQEIKMRLLNNPVIAIIVAFIIAVILFYLLNHGIMSMQGLPLNADLTPAQ